MLTLGRDLFTIGILSAKEWKPDLAGYGRYFVNELANDVGVKCMPPTPMVKDMTVEAQLGEYPPELKVKVDYQVSPEANDIYRSWVSRHGVTIARDMMNYRQRCSIGSGCLRMNEFEKKLHDYETNVPILDELIEPYNDLFLKIAKGIKSIKAERVEKLHIGSHTEKFISDHADSACAPGLKWGECSQADLEVLLESVIQVQTWLIDNWDDCITDSEMCYALYPPSCHVGGRHRGLKDFSYTKGHIEDTITRERIVAYNGSIGGFNAFCEDVSTMYGEIIEYAKSYLFPNTPIICPVVQGGKVYGMLKDALVDGNHYQNVDVSTYDNYAVRICKLAGPHALPCGSLNLMSGADSTSWVGSLGDMELCYAQALAQDLHPVVLGILGDDSAWVLPENETFKSLPGIQEEDLMGSRLQHYLGFSLLSDEGYFHPTGFKVTGDKARADMPLGAQPVPWNHNLSEQEVKAYVSVFKGEYVTDSGEVIPLRVILDGLNLSKEDYVSPALITSKIQQNMFEGVYNEFRQSDNDDTNCDVPNTDTDIIDEYRHV